MVGAGVRELHAGHGKEKEKYGPRAAKYWSIVSAVVWFRGGSALREMTAIPVREAERNKWFNPNPHATAAHQYAPD